MPCHVAVAGHKHYGRCIEVGYGSKRTPPTSPAAVTMSTPLSAILAANAPVPPPTSNPMRTWPGGLRFRTEVMLSLWPPCRPSLSHGTDCSCKGMTGEAACECDDGDMAVMRLKGAESAVVLPEKASYRYRYSMLACDRFNFSEDVERCSSHWMF